MKLPHGQRSFFWYIFPFAILFVAAATGLVFYYSSQSQSQLFEEVNRRDLTDRSKLFRKLAMPLMKSENYTELQSMSQQLGVDTGTRITVILPSGKVVADSDRPPWTMDAQAEHPEVKAALSGGTGVSTRLSHGTRQKRMYVAMPLREDSGPVLGVVRISRYANQLIDQLDSQRDRNILVLAIVLAVVAVFIWFWSWRMVLPVRNIKKIVDDIATGKFSTTMAEEGTLPDEFLSVVSSLNKIAGEMDASKTEMIRNQIQQGVILGNMSEGILAIRADGQIDHMNKAAQEILGVTYSMERRLAVAELMRLPILQKFIRKSMEKKEKREREITLDEGSSNEKIFIIRSSPVFSDDRVFQGSILVLLDVTELRKLERHRQEFVSNVSHELKTPLTSIKGFAETMQNPAMESVSEMKRYSGIVLRQADHLNALIDDLLTLSKLENEMEFDRSEMEQVSLMQLIRRAKTSCEATAKGKNILVDESGAEDCVVTGNPSLLTQAIVNLLENAIKYSPENTEVKISTERHEKSLKVLVKDQGPGIASEALPHLFERFYRVDRGRSRDQGGTGLGLAIVKHIMNVHGGEASVQSEIGAGSQFALCFPLELIKH